MEMALRMCQEELHRYLTNTGKVKTGGALSLQQGAVATLREKQTELETKSNDMRNELERRRDLRRSLSELEDPEEKEARTKRVIEADTAHARSFPPPCGPGKSNRCGACSESRVGACFGKTRAA